MKKSLLVTMGLAAAIFVSLAFTGHDDPIYKNLKILPKNITKQQMDSVMHHFSLSLGVRCNFCHVRNDSARTWDFASDDNKHKLIAREMMTMTDKINDKYFDMTNGKRDLNTRLMVTCYTCHHGAAEPATTPPMPPMDEQRQPRPNNGMMPPPPPQRIDRRTWRLPPRSTVIGVSPWMPFSA